MYVCVCVVVGGVFVLEIVSSIFNIHCIVSGFLEVVIYFVHSFLNTFSCL